MFFFDESTQNNMIHSHFVHITNNNNTLIIIIFNNNNNNDYVATN